MNTRKHIFASLILLLIYVETISAQTLTGKKAPRFTAAHFFQRPDDSTPEGKIVVLEFWATWCSPCLANLAHLNSLHDHFRDSDVVFISVTDESKNRIAAFLKKRKMNGWVACDTSRETFHAYGVGAIPHTFVIGKTGTVVYDGRPEGLTEKLMNDILQNKVIAQPVTPVSGKPKLGSWGGGSDPVFTGFFPGENAIFPYQHTIRKSVGSSGNGWSLSKKHIGITILGNNMPGLFSQLLNTPSYHRILNISSVHDSLKWDIIYSRNKPYELEQGYEEIILSLKATFNIRISDTIVKRTVLIPIVRSSSGLMQKKDIDFEDPTVKTYRSLSEMYSMIEEEEGNIIIEDHSDDIYIDTFDIFSKLYTMSAKELKNWLHDHGVDFASESRQIKLICIADSR